MIAAPSPIGLIAISTVTATISAIPAARRNARKIRGSAAGMMIFRTRSTGDRRSARDTSIRRGSIPPTAARVRIRIGQTHANATITISMR
jgi:hypothetical protein